MLANTHVGDGDGLVAIDAQILEQVLDEDRALGNIARNRDLGVIGGGELDGVGGRLAGGGSGSSRHVDCGCVYCWCVRKGCRSGVVEGGGCCWWRGVLWMCKIIESRKARELIYSSSASTIGLCGACAGVG